MKTKKSVLLIVAALAVLVVAALAVTGCASRPDRLFAGEAESANVVTTASVVYTADAGGVINVAGISGTELAWITKTDAAGNNTYALYNFVTNTEIIPFTANLSQSSINGITAVTRTETVDGETRSIYSVYDAAGTAIVTNSENLPNVAGTDPSYFTMNGTAYLFDDDGVLEAKFAMGYDFDAAVLESDYKSDNYYYAKNGNYVKIMSAGGSFIRTINAASHANASTEATNVHYLSGDKIVVQYLDYRPFDATRYDFLYQGSKVELRTFIYNVEKDKWSEKKSFKYMINSISAASHEGEGAYDESVTDIMYAREFSKKTLAAVASLYSVNDNLKVKVAFDDVIENYDYHKAVSDGYIVSTRSEDTYFMSANGKTATPFVEGSFFGGYMDDERGVIYSFSDGNVSEAGRYDANIYSVSYITDGGKVFYYNNEDGAYYSGAVGAAPVKIGDDTAAVNMDYIGCGFYIVTNSAAEYATSNIYSADGNAVRSSISGTVSVLVSDSDSGVALAVVGSEIVRIA